MRKEVQLFLNQNEELKQFVRSNPIWYRYLSRNPNSIQQLQQEVKQYYGQTFPQKIERFQSNLNLVMMLLEMMSGFESTQ